MSIMPVINMRRTMLIARRDFLGYVKTWGFWLSFFLPFILMIIGGIIGIAAATFHFDVTPTRYETILDKTGVHAQALRDSHEDRIKEREKDAILALKDFGILPKDQVEAIEAIYEAQGIEGVKSYVIENTPITQDQIDKTTSRISSDLVFVDPPANTLDGLRPYLRDEKLITIDGEQVKLNGALIISPPRTEEDGEAYVQYWSQNFNQTRVKTMAENYFKERAETAYLNQGGLNRKDLKAARTIQPYQTFDPTKAQGADKDSQAVTQSDKLPFYVAGILSGILWLTVFSGSYMLLTSMLEEKLNKLLEMMLASTRFSEIIFGKLLGVAGITLLAMSPYILSGIVGVIGYIAFGPDSEIVNGLINSFSAKMIVFFIIYLVLGYLFYGAFFIALGALSQSMQDAQTLTTPITIILTLMIWIVPYGISNPDSPILTFASLFPLSAPFAALVRLPSDPPLWELILSTIFLAMLTIGVIALASRVFRFGVLSGSGAKAVTDWFKRTVLRQKIT